MKFISLFACVYIVLSINRSADDAFVLILWEKHPVKLT